MGFSASGVQASYGKGKSNTDSVTQHNSHVGSGGKTTIESGGTTTIAGAQVTGNRVEIDAADLNIVSLQDTSKSHSDQFDASLQVTVGYGFSASGSLAMSKSNADYASVGEQSGIIAGDGGYKVNVKNHTNMVGGIVTSSQAAEDAGLNSFSTGTLTASDVENHADYSASGFSVGGGFGVNGSGEKGKYQTAQGSSTTTVDQSGKSVTTYPAGRAGTKANKSFGIGSDSDHDNSTTASGINTRNITITDTAGQVATGKSVDQIKADVATNVVTDTVDANSGHIDNNYDAQAVSDEINLQVRVSQKFDTNRQQAKAEINTKINEKQKAIDAIKAANGGNDTADSLKLQGEIDSWQRGGIVLDMVAGGLSGPSNTGAIGIAARTLAPAVSYEIGQYFKEHGTEGSASHIVAHTILGAATAYLSGGDALVGGLAAGGAEAVAPAVTRYLYGNIKPSELTAEQKSTVSAIVGLGGIAIGAGVNGSVGDMASGGQLAQNAVENNFLYPPELADMRKERRQCSVGASSQAAEASCLSKVESKYTRKSTEHNIEMVNECSARPAGTSCTLMKSSAKSYLNDSYIKQLGWGWTSSVALAQVSSEVRAQNNAALERMERKKQLDALAKTNGNQQRYDFSENPPTFFQSDVGTTTLGIIAAPAAVVEAVFAAPIIPELAALCTGVCATTATLTGTLMEVQSLATDDVPLGVGMGSQFVKIESQAAKAVVGAEKSAVAGTVNGTGNVIDGAVDISRARTVANSVDGTGYAGQTVQGTVNGKPTVVGSAADHLYSSSRPMEEVFPELAGVNPHYVENAAVGVNTNCVSCANATQQRLIGQNPNAVAAPSTGRYANQNALLPSAPFGFPSETTSVAAVQQEMLRAGNGAVGVVVVEQGNVAHVINTVNRNGQVYFIDSQLGKIVTLQPNVPVKLGRP